MSLSELKSILQACGIVGAGGAGFPSFAKLAEGADTLVINGAECEPLIYTDYALMRESLAAIVSGATHIMAATGITQTFLAVKKHRAEMLGLAEGEHLADGVSVKLLPDVYPMGDEINLIYEATGRLIPPGSLPITKGVIVLNSETLYNVDRAVSKGKPVTDKWVTVGGEIEKPRVVRVPVGMRVRELLEKLGVTLSPDHRLIDGGPSMGRLINPNTAVVTKTTKALLILPKDVPAVAHKTVSVDDMLRRAASCCCGCSRCTEMCPRHLLGYPIEPHKMIRAANNAAIASNPVMAVNASLCCSCGVCAEVCCQDISPKDVILSLKGLLAKSKLRFSAGNGEYTPFDDRAYHLIPSSRWETMLGVRRFDAVPVFERELIAPRAVEIPLSGHIGAPSVPVVKAGDRVTRGTVIAECAAGLSLPQHASICGTVTLVDDKKIVIEAN
ncbi:MAG: SLBB domain-containing protein [Clostridia bacterium]|nr:SLBB domain-containing protein [Clostridia bacterium]